MSSDVSRSRQQPASNFKDMLGGVSETGWTPWAIRESQKKESRSSSERRKKTPSGETAWGPEAPI
jgi:hypothetical protein